MLSLMQAALLAMLTACMCVLLRSVKPEFAFLCGIAGSLAAFALALPSLREIVSGLRQIAGLSQMDESVSALVRACAVVLVCEFASAVCRDAGQAALAGRIEFCGRAFLGAMCVPVMLSLLNSLGSLSFLS